MIRKAFEKIDRSYIFFAVIFLLAAALRISNLVSLPIFGDEAIYIRWSQVMNAEPGLRFLPLTDGKQPLFMWVLMFLVNRFADPLFIGRLTSVVYGLVTLVGIFLLSRSLFKSKRVALVASLFWAVSPYSLFYDRLALVDSLLTMFGVWSLLFLVLAVKSFRNDYAMLAGFTLGGALLTKSPGIYFLAMAPVSWIVSAWPKRRDKSIGKREVFHALRLSWITAIAAAIAYAMYNILRLGEAFHMISIRNKDYVYPISQLWISPLHPLIENMNQAFDWIWQMGGNLILVFVLIGLIAYLRKVDFKKKRFINAEIALLFIWSFLPLFVSSVYAKVFTARYNLFILPTLFIFAATIFDFSWTKNEMLKKVLWFGLALYLLISLNQDITLITAPERAGLPRVVRSGFLEEWTSGYGIKETAKVIRDEYESEPDKQIVVGTEGYFGTLPDGLQIYLNDLKEVLVIGVGIDIKELPESLKETREAGNKTYLVINDSRLKADPDELGLELVAAYPKAFRPQGSHAYNLRGPRETLYLFEVK